MAVQDIDQGANGDVRFTILYRDFEDRRFGVRWLSNTQAEVYANEMFDREELLQGGERLNGEIMYPVRLSAQDGGQPSLSATCFFFVTIDDANDNVPRFDGGDSDVSNYVPVP